MEKSTLDIVCISAIRSIYNHMHYIAPGTGVRKALKYSTVSGRTLNTWCKINYNCNLRTLLQYMRLEREKSVSTEADIANYRRTALWDL